MNILLAPLALFGPLGNWEFLVILGVALLLFGTRIPAVMRSMGRGVTEFKKGLKDSPTAVGTGDTFLADQCKDLRGTASGD